MFTLGLLHQRMLNAHIEMYGDGTSPCVPLVSTTPLYAHTILGCNVTVEQRYITELLASMQSHGAFTDQLVIPANTDFDLEFKASIIDTSIAQRFFGSEQATPANEIRLDVPANRVRFIASDGYSDFTGTYAVFSPAALLTYRFTRVGTTVSLFINGIPFGTQSNDRAFTADYIGRHTANYFSGTIADVLLWTGGDRVTGTQILDCPLDEGPSIPYFANRAATLGSEQWQSSECIHIGSPTINGNDFTITTTGDLEGVRVDNLNTFSDFVVSGNAVVRSGAVEVTVEDSWSGANFTITDSGRFTFVLGTGASDRNSVAFKRQFGAGNVDVDLTDVSIREIPAATPYITKENINDSQTLPYDPFFSVTRGGYYQAADGERLNLAAYEAGRTDRAITRFLDSVNSYGQLTDSINVAAGQNFRVSLYVERSSLSQSAIVGGTATGGDLSRVFQFSNDTLEIANATGAIFTGALSGIPVGSLYELRFERSDGANIELTVAGSSKGTMPFADAFEIDLLSREMAGVASTGTAYYYDLEVEVEGTLVLDCPLDEPASTPYFANRAATLGSEQWNNPPPQVQDTWVDNGNSTYTKVSNNFNRLGYSPGDGLADNTTYLLEFTTSGAMRVFTRNTADTDNEVVGDVVAGTHSLVIPVTTGGIWFDDSNALGVTISNISIREIPATTPFITKENINDSQTKEFSYNRAIDWLGPELWTYGDYSTTGSESQSEVLLGVGSGALQTGAIYRSDGTSEVPSNTIRLLVASDSVRPDDWPDTSAPAANTRLQLQYTSATPPTAGLVTSGITVRRLLQEA